MLYSELFPAPVRPQTPIRSPALIARLTSMRTGEFSRYDIVTLLNTTAPVSGQF